MGGTMEDGKQNWTFGAGATSTEKGLVYAASVIGCAVVAVGARDLGWEWWRWVIALVMAWDLAGGVVANGLDTAKRFYHSPLTPSTGPLLRFLHHPVGFPAAHLQPVIVGLVFPGAAWWWGALWYLWVLAASGGVYRMPERLKRPVALAAAGTGVLVASFVSAPHGMGWFPAVLLLKLVVAHSVPEGAGRTAEHGPGADSAT